MTAVKLTACSCGGKGRVVAQRVAEDLMETWVQCQSCGWCAGEVEDAYSDPGTAAWNWNAAQRDRKARSALQEASHD